MTQQTPRRVIRNNKGTPVIKNGSQFTMEDFNEDEVLYISTHNIIKNDNIIIKTTNKTIIDLIKDLSKQKKYEIIKLSNDIYKTVISINTDKIYENKIMFNKFCDHIIFIMVCHNILYNKPIPITPFSSFNPDGQKELNKLNLN
jgi:hypothetical protein